jgi:hypothetical protein
VADEGVIASRQSSAGESSPAPEDGSEGQHRAALAKIAQLEIAVEHRTVIGQAVGILIERYHLDAKAAFRVLSRVSQDTNRKVYEIANELSDTGQVQGLGGDVGDPARRWLDDQDLETPTR